MMQDQAMAITQDRERKWRTLSDLIDELVELLAREALFLVQDSTPPADLVQRKEAVELAYTFLCRNLFAEPLGDADRQLIRRLGLEQRVLRVITLARQNQISLAHHRQALCRMIDSILQETFAENEGEVEQEGAHGATRGALHLADPSAMQRQGL